MKTAFVQLLSFLAVSLHGVQAIRVKFGTNDGPIVPPTPEPEVRPQPPFRVPAPVWEDRSKDTPDPNANWRPPLFTPQTRYTQVVYNNQPQQTPAPQTEAQKFVNAYLPKKPTDQPLAPQPRPSNELFKPAFISSQNIPGVGIRYFIPIYINDLQKKKEEVPKQEDAKHNAIENNEVGDTKDDASDKEWKYEKEAKRRARASQESSHQGVAYYNYQWPAYVPYRHQYQ